MNRDDLINKGEGNILSKKITYISSSSSEQKALSRGNIVDQDLEFSWPGPLESNHEI
jgi:hypothetical protein